ncbi:MAG: cob(I)yrinic acid a,c-diamide adenosyltransferase [Dehalococcoidales bacterium]|nr:cob(I)yrinic acid a,c-diamide adenosyltransferase [Dehalococcoidales bacterium]
MKGLVQVITGEGKGKTSAALGSVVRAVGHGLRVAVIVFMKGDYPYGEWSVLSGLPNVKIFRFGFRTFTDPRNVKPEEKEQARQAMDAAREAVFGGNFDLVILDEINVATAWKLAELDKVIEIIREKPANVELILTGRYADKQLVELADMVTECLKIKHPYDKGIGARAGFDY